MTTEDPDSVTMPDGRVITDLTPDEYDATYSDPDADTEHIPEDVLAQAIRDADQMGAQQ